MLRFLLLLASLCLLVAPTSRAQGPTTLPPVVTKGLAIFQSQGADAGVKALTPNWSGAEDQDKQQQLIDALKKVQEYAGALAGYDLLRLHSITPHLSRAYVVLLFERQPAFLVLTLYTAPGRDVAVMTFNFHTDPTKVFPPALIEPGSAPSAP